MDDETKKALDMVYEEGKRAGVRMVCKGILDGYGADYKDGKVAGKEKEYLAAVMRSVTKISINHKKEV